MRILVILLFIIPATQISICQISLSQQVISSYGSSGSGESSTVGETIIFGGKNNIMACQGFQSGLYYLLTGTQNFSDSQFSIFPNPANSTLNVYLEFQNVRRLNLSDLTGQLIKTWMVTEKTSQMEIDVSTISSGIYVFSVTDTNLTVTKRLLVIQH